MPFQLQACPAVSVVGPSHCLNFLVKWLGASGLPVTACRTKQELLLDHTSIVIVESGDSFRTIARSAVGKLAECDGVEVISISCSFSLEEPQILRGSLERAETHFHLPRQLGRLICHLRARSEQQVLPEAGFFALGSLVVNSATREVCTAEGEVTLTALQFDLLIILMKDPGRVFSARELLRQLPRLQTGSQDAGVVRYHIARLRARLGTAAQYIENVRGCGYRAQDALLD